MHEGSQEGLEEALVHFRAAIDPDETFGPYAGLAGTYEEFEAPFYGGRPTERSFAGSRRTAGTAEERLCSGSCISECVPRAG
jgi:hypothetical protein